MPVIVDMGNGTFKVLQDEPRDQIVNASMGDYQRAIDQGQATPWREPQQFQFDPALLNRQYAPTYQGQILGDPNYVVPASGATVGQSTGGYAGGGGGYSSGTGYGGRQLDYSGPRAEYAPSFGVQPQLAPERPTPLNPYIVDRGPMSAGAPTFAPQQVTGNTSYPVGIAQSPALPPYRPPQPAIAPAWRESLYAPWAGVNPQLAGQMQQTFGSMWR